MIKKIIAIILLPIIILITSDLTKVKEVIHEDFTITSKTGNTYSIDKDLYSILSTYQDNKNYTISSSNNITNDSIEYGTLCVSELICNEIVTDENGQERIIENVGQVTFNGSENWVLLGENNDIVLFRLLDSSNLDRYNENKISNWDLNHVLSVGTTEQYNYEGFSLRNDSIYLQLLKTRGILTVNNLITKLSQNPLIVTYELAVKNPIEINLWEYDTIFYEDKLTNTYLFLIEDVVYNTGINLKMLGGKLNNLTKKSSGIEDVEGYYFHSDISGVISINVSTIDNLMSQYSTDEEGALKIYLEQENIYGIFELVQPRLAETYEIENIKYTYDPNDKSYNISINEGYNEFKLLPDNTIQAVTGPQLLDNTYSITYNVYQIEEPMVRNIVEIIPLIYIGVVIVYIFISRKD